MKLVTFLAGPDPRLGALVGDMVLDLSAAAGRHRPEFSSMIDLIEAGPVAWQEARELAATPAKSALCERSGVQLLAPLPKPTRLRDCSLFLEHMDVVLERMARETAAKEPDPETAFHRLMESGKYTLHPAFREGCLYYNADHNSVSGTNIDIIWPSYSHWMDFELEWACVIGVSGKNIRREAARDHMFGFTILNDWSARDVQLPLMETMLGPGEGKDFANSWGMGPCIATPDEFDDPYGLTMTARVNGEVWTTGTTGSMHHKFEDAIVQFSREKTLLAGEVLGSGTVLGGCGFELGRRLSHGDRVELEIEKIGVLANRVMRPDKGRD